MLGIDARVEDTKKEIKEIINKAQMPVCLIDYILTEIINDVRMSRISMVQKEREAFENEKREAFEKEASEKPKTETVYFPTPENPTPKKEGKE